MLIKTNKNKEENIILFSFALLKLKFSYYENFKDLMSLRTTKNIISHAKIAMYFKIKNGDKENFKNNTKLNGSNIKHIIKNSILANKIKIGTDVKLSSFIFNDRNEINLRYSFKKMNIVRENKIYNSKYYDSFDFEFYDYLELIATLKNGKDFTKLKNKDNYLKALEILNDYENSDKKDLICPYIFKKSKTNFYKEYVSAFIFFEENGFLIKKENGYKLNRYLVPKNIDDFELTVKFENNGIKIKIKEDDNE